MNDFTAVFKGEITAPRISNWMSQFEKSDREVIAKLVEYFRYYTSSDVFSLVERLWSSLRSEHGVAPESSWFVPSGYVAKSGDAVAYFFRRHNELPEEAFLRVSDLTSDRFTQRNTVVFVDDFIGSGQEALFIASGVVEPLRVKAPGTKFIFAAMVGYEDGIKRIVESKAMDVCIVDVLKDETRPFSTNSIIFPEPESRAKAEQVVRKYCSILKPKSPLGYGETQGLVGFFFGTPNNTLPIFWSKSAGWNPLLPHGESLRDPNRIIEIPGGRLALTANRERLSIVDNSLEVSKEATAALYEGFQTLDNMQIVARIANNVGIDDAVLSSLVAAIQTLQEERHEGNPVRTALLFSSPENLDKIRSTLFVELSPPPRIDNRGELKTVAQLVDGIHGAVLVSQTGELLGPLLYMNDFSGEDPLLPSAYKLAAGATKAADGFLVLFLGEGRVTILDRGIRVMSRRYAKWHIQGKPRNAGILEAEHGLTTGALDRILKIAFILADSGDGALFTIGDSKGILTYCGKRAPTHYKFRRISLLEGDEEAILSLARQDGATVIASDGSLEAAMVILQPPAEAEGDEELGKGTRHNAASKISATTGALAVSVSEDGTITLYSKGRRVFRIMG